MADPAQQALELVNTLTAYYEAGGDRLPNGGAQPTPAGIYRSMVALIKLAVADDGARRVFSTHSMYEKTLSPTTVWPDRFVDSILSRTMLDGIDDQALGLRWHGIRWTNPSAAGLTEWIGSEAGGLHYTIGALLGPPWLIGGAQIERDPAELAGLLKLLAEAAIPASWFQGLMRENVFPRLEVKISSSTYGATERRVLLQLAGQAAGRVAAELAKLASARVLPSFPAGDGAPAATVPPVGRPWYRRGSVAVAAGVGLIIGAAAAR